MQTDRTRSPIASRFSPILRRFCLLLLVVGGFETSLRATDGDLPDFDRDVQPILARHCLLCHGFDPSSRKAKLRLDVAEGPDGAYRVKGGVASIAPGSLEDSEFWYRITTTDEDDVMPPPKAHKPLLKLRLTLFPLPLWRRWLHPLLSAKDQRKRSPLSWQRWCRRAFP